MRRRVRRLVTRVGSPRYVFVLRHAEAWPRQRRAVARACFVQGLSMRDAARDLGLSLHTVRRHYDAVAELEAFHTRSN